MALQDNYINLCFVEKKMTSDGMGGYDVVYADGEEFKGAITTDSSTLAKIAEKDGVTSLYTLTTHRNIPLTKFDIVKRLSDNQMFRITSNPEDIQSPQFARLDIKQASLEKWTPV